VAGRIEDAQFTIAVVFTNWRQIHYCTTTIPS